MSGSDGSGSAVLSDEGSGPDNPAPLQGFDRIEAELERLLAATGVPDVAPRRDLPPPSRAGRTRLGPSAASASSARLASFLAAGRGRLTATATATSRSVRARARAVVSRATTAARHVLRWGDSTVRSVRRRIVTTSASARRSISVIARAAGDVRRRGDAAVRTAGNAGRQAVRVGTAAGARRIATVARTAATTLRTSVATMAAATAGATRSVRTRVRRSVSAAIRALGRRRSQVTRATRSATVSVGRGVRRSVVVTARATGTVLDGVGAAVVGAARASRTLAAEVAGATTAALDSSGRALVRMFAGTVRTGGWWAGDLVRTSRGTIRSGARRLRHAALRVRRAVGHGLLASGRAVRAAALAGTRAVTASVGTRARRSAQRLAALYGGLRGGLRRRRRALRIGLVDAGRRLRVGGVTTARTVGTAGSVAVTRSARMLLAAVARASLRAQDLADARATRHRAQRQEEPARAPAASRPSVVGGSRRPARRPVPTGLARVVGGIGRRGLQVTGAIAVAVLVVGVGRADVTATSTSDVEPATAPDTAPAEQDGSGTDADGDGTGGTVQTAAPEVDAAPGSAPAALDDGTAPSVPVAEAARDGRPARPLEVRLPSLRVTAPLVDVGVEPDGAMEIPEDVRTVGWYEPGPGRGVVPGEAGTAVLAGHVDSRVQGRGAFWGLRELTPGDRVEVVHEDGTTSTWEVTDVVRYPKAEVPIADIFVWSGPTRLALITCGGEFDRSVGSYLDNYVVTARPVEADLLDGGITSAASG